MYIHTGQQKQIEDSKTIPALLDMINAIAQAAVHSKA